MCSYSRPFQKTTVSLCFIYLLRVSSLFCRRLILHAHHITSQITFPTHALLCPDPLFAPSCAVAYTTYLRSTMDICLCIRSGADVMGQKNRSDERLNLCRFHCPTFSPSCSIFNISPCDPNAPQHSSININISSCDEGNRKGPLDIFLFRWVDAWCWTSKLLFDTYLSSNTKVRRVTDCPLSYVPLNRLNRSIFSFRRCFRFLPLHCFSNARFRIVGWLRDRLFSKLHGIFVNPRNLLCYYSIILHVFWRHVVILRPRPELFLSSSLGLFVIYTATICLKPNLHHLPQATPPLTPAQATPSLLTITWCMFLHLHRLPQASPPSPTNTFPMSREQQRHHQPHISHFYEHQLRRNQHPSIAQQQKNHYWHRCWACAVARYRKWRSHSLFIFLLRGSS